ncbi:MAG TPA: hypothetical protein VGD42_02240, partial [Lysobacter sp.]
MNKRNWGLALVMALAAMGHVHAGNSRTEVRKQTELSMLLTGHIEIERDGSVLGYVLDNAAKLPPITTRLMDRASRGWHFEPIVI